MNYQILFISIATFLAFYSVFLSIPTEGEKPPNDDSNTTNIDDNDDPLKIVN